MKKSSSDSPENSALSVSSAESDDSLVIYDRSSRRQFIRNGTAFLFAGSTVSFSNSVLANDCDRAPDEETPKQAGNGSDSDTGSSADRAGCGREQDKPKITQYRSNQPSGSTDSDKTVTVVKVVG